jgi:hypothetical protein
MSAMIVTTTKQADATSEARAREVAERCALPFVKRTDSVARLMRRHDVDTAYVVGPKKVDIRQGGHKLLVNASMYQLTQAAGRTHPLLHAISPSAEPPVSLVLDATLGLAKDALQVAGILGCRVKGLECVPVLACLAVDGLARLAKQARPWAVAATQIEVCCTEAVSWMRTQEANSFDVVYLDPMFRQKLSAPPGFELLRRLARAEPLSMELLDEALRLARLRAVVKVPKSTFPREYGPDPAIWNRVLFGKRVQYLVVEKSGLVSPQESLR